MLNELLRKIDDRTARVGIVGLGYVGIPLAMRISEMGLPVLGFDILPERIRQLSAGESPIRHIPGGDRGNERARISGDLRLCPRRRMRRAVDLRADALGQAPRT